MFTQISEPFRALAIDVIDNYEFLNTIFSLSFLVLLNSIYFTVTKNIYG